MSIYRRVHELLEKRRPAALVTVVQSAGSTPRKAGAKMIVFPDGSIEDTIGGGILEKRVIEASIQVIQHKESQLVHLDLRENQPDSIGAICGGEVSVFIEPVGAMSRLIIFGAGHVGQTLSRMAVELDFQVVVYDDRPDFATPERFPDQVQVTCAPFEDIVTELQPVPSDFLAIMTYRHLYDSLVLKLLLESMDTPARYIGMIGSELKCMQVKDDLVKQGVSRSLLDQVHAPIGLPIGGHTPAEVAVSVMAEIVKVSNSPAS